MTSRFINPSVLILSLILLFSLTLSGHAISSYLAAVSVGNYANYAPVKAIFHTDNQLIPEPQNVKDLNATVLNKVTVQTVSSPATNVTAATYTLYKNGTSTLATVFGDLETGKGNLTFGLIAGGLSHPERIWNNATAPVINETTTMSFLGTSRTVNVLNMTRTFTETFGAISIHFSTMEYFVWDQASGIALRVIGSGSFSSIIASGDFYVEAAITATDVFSAPSPPDFQITASLNSVTALAGATATSTITITPVNGFSGDVALSTSISPSSGLTCTLSTSTITGGSGTSTLSCSGSYWGYTVTVTGESGTLSHAVPVQITVQDYSIGVSSSNISTNTGSAGTSTITISSHDGFDGAVNLASSVSASGLSCTMTPASFPTGSGTSTLSCSGLTGTYSVTITATSGSLSHTTQVSVSVASAQPRSAASSPTIFGLSPTLFYGIIGGIVVVVVAGVVIALGTRKRQTQPSVPSWSPAGPSSP